MTLAFLIDGYNLIHALGLVHKKIAPKELENARRHLLEFLHERLEPLSGDITVVFDAKRRPARVAAEQQEGGILIRYAGKNQEADDLIEELLAKNATPRRLVVVSEDRRLRDAAKRRHALSWSGQDLLAHLERRPAPRRDAADPEAERRPMSAKEVEEWLHEFRDVKLPNEFQEFLDPPQDTE